MAGVPPGDPRGGRDAGDRPLTPSAPRAPRRPGRGRAPAGVPAAPPPEAEAAASGLAARLLRRRPRRAAAWAAAALVLASFAAGVGMGLFRGADPDPAPAASGPAAAPPAARAPAAEGGDGVGAALRRLDGLARPGAARGRPTPAEAAMGVRVDGLRERALAARREGDPASALRLLGDAERILRQAARDSEARYRLSLEAAREAHGRGALDAARAHLARALEERPGAPEATALRSLIESPPAPAAPDAAARETARRAGSLARALGEGRLAVENGDPAAARRALAAAEAAGPGHGGVRDLRARVERLERGIERDRLVAGAEDAAARDDWKGALRGFAGALDLDPGHNAAARGRDLAARVAASQAAVDGFLERPERLSDAEVAGAAGGALDAAAPLAPLSPRLRDSAGELRAAVAARRAPLPVRVLSDNRTEIGIRGVGHLGRVRERVVELPPGTYAFEGRREGYRSKIVEVVVEAGAAPPAEVRIVCDEPG